MALSVYEERIIRILKRGRRALTTKQISEYSEISYNTTKKYLIRLYNKKYLTKKTLSNKIYWNNK